MEIMFQNYEIFIIGIFGCGLALALRVAYKTFQELRRQERASHEYIV